MRDPELWQRIQDNLVAGPVALEVVETADVGPLATRLNEDEDWELGYARGAVREYGRFMYLSRVSTSRVTPSDVIDTVWHTHLADSRAYVEEFCRAVFGEIVHHVPSTGPTERARHEGQFEETLALYEEEFGSAPPPEYWFHYTPEQEVADRRQHRFAKLSGVVTGIGLTAILYMLFGWIGLAIFLGIAAAWILEAVLSPRVPGPRLKPTDSDGGSGCGD